MTPRQLPSESVAPDGSPVAVYLTLSGADDAALVHDAVPTDAAILELGCGVGRVSRHLVAFGHPVTGVDESEAMLAHASDLDGVETVLAEIATLDLSPRTWAVVLLSSHMVNDEQGPEFLVAASRHLARDGMVLVERHTPGWIDAAEPTAGERDGVRVRLAHVDHAAPGVLHATMIYEVAGRAYRQPFVAHEVDDERLGALAARAGLGIVGFLDGERTWVALRRR